MSGPVEIPDPDVRLVVHVLRGVIKAVDEIDLVFALIRESETADACVAGLVELLDIDDRQAAAILRLELIEIGPVLRYNAIQAIARIESGDYSRVSEWFPLAFPDIEPAVYAPVVTERLDDQSPFEAGRIPCPQGGEDRWSARWLMAEMGYARWEDFEKVIERAKAAARNEGFNVNILFQVFRSTPKNTGGRPQTDYHMTRYAAYLTAMSGDSRKPQCAAAMHYFAVKTRQAEVAAAPEALDLTDPDVALDKIIELASMAKSERAARIAAESKTKALTVRIERDAPLVAKAEAHTASQSTIHRQEFAREVQAWGVKQGVDIKHEDVYEFLRHKNMLVNGMRSDRNHATAEAVKRGWAWTDKGTTEDGHPYATTRLFPAGQDIAWKWITKYVGEHGSLRLRGAS